jgi:Ser/Thr protein kinase RdoA (MazF antagonist)
MRAQATPDLDAVLGRYPLEAPSVLGKHEAGVVNDNWLVAVSSGKRYFLRGYRRVLDPERVLFQLRFQEHLLAQGYPTAAVVRTRGGEPFTTEDGIPWALFDHVEGDEFDFSRLTQAKEAGRRLAEFETTAAGYDGTVTPVTTGEADFSETVAPVSSHMWRNSVLAEEHDERLRHLFAGQEFDSDLAFFSEWRRRAAAAWPPERLAALPRSWLHCDYHGRNMVFRDDEMAGLFDFDFVTRGPRSYDLGRGIFNFGRERRGSTTLREAFCRAFLEGYESGAPLSGEERQSLAFMVVLNWAPEASFYTARLPHEGDERIAERLRHDVRLMRATESEMQRLAPLFGWTVV